LAGFFESLSILRRLGVPYFRSEDRLPACVLLALVIGVQIAVVGMSVVLNRWYNGFYGSLQDRNWNTFTQQVIHFCLIAAAITLLSVYQLYLNQWFEIRWRRWMTKSFLARWLSGATHYHVQLFSDPTDNPDQRIAEDIKLFIEQTLTIGVGLLGALMSVLSFMVILWRLSDAAPLHLFGTTYAIPGYLLWAALTYAVAGTVITHLIGRPLTMLNFDQQRYEADFRFNLVRVRENSEQIALLRGETLENGRLLTRFEKVASNWYAIMSRQKWLTLFTSGYTQFSIIFPIAVVSPAYFAGAMQLGGLVQTAAAFATVQTALSFFVSIYPTFAQWRAVVARLDGFERAMAAKRAEAGSSGVTVVAHPTDEELSIEGVSVELPTGTPLMASDDLVIKAGQSALITGPSGAGKSTFFRAVAGVWPFGAGRVTIRRGSKLMVLPQRPYFPIAPLEEAVSYPAGRGTFDSMSVAEVLKAVGLPALADRLSDEAHWTQILSLGEQQRLSIARAILHAPHYLFLDEATASLDEPSEQQLYKLLQERIPDVAIISIGHRSTLEAFHDRRWTLQPGEGRHHIRAAQPVTRE
jgi:vitamin B12/bleomycin/antimicrobial peptide transport system ATP-binding/permease protein